MTETDLAFASAGHQRTLLRERSISAVELTTMYLTRIERFNEELNAFVSVCSEQALEAAARVDAEMAQGIDLGPLHGIPFGVKDVMAVEGVRVTGGSRVPVRFDPGDEATVVRRLRRAGAVFLGTLNTHEFMFGTTRAFPYGTPRNPWNVEHVTGGSSAGSGSAVAAGLCSLSIGTDTGASVRTPASLCGVVGLRPTWSRVSRHGVLPGAWSLDCVGTLTRRVQDAATVLGVVAGRDRRDPTASSIDVPHYPEGPTTDLRGVRVGVVRQMVEGEGFPEATKLAVAAAMDVLTALGATMTSIELPEISSHPVVSPALTMAEAPAFHRQRLLKHYDDFDANTRTRLLAGASVPAGLIAFAQRARVRIARSILHALENTDVLLGATTRGGAHRLAPAKRVGSRQEASAELNGVGGGMGQSERRAFSLAGVPALSVPCGFDPLGLPLGLHVVAKPFDEAMALRVAHAYQLATSWKERRPQAFAA